MPIEFRGGRLPLKPEIEAPRLKIGPALTHAALPPAPAIVDWLSEIPSWPMNGNADWGCCVEAEIAHTIQAITSYGQGSMVQISLIDVLAAYSAITGFDPSAGPPGRNPTDRGTVMQEAFSYWRRIGVGGHKILAFALVDHTNAAEVEEVMNLFGHLSWGLNFPRSAMVQFNRGEPWGIVDDDGGIEGRHAINVGYDDLSKGLRGVTWERVQDITPAFWNRYGEELWVPISQEWINENGLSPSGLDLTVLGKAFTKLTGEPSPFTPTPKPVPVRDPLDLKLVADLNGWLTSGLPWGQNAHARNVIRTWEYAKGLRVR